MADGAVELLLRRQLRADGTPGIGSGWLCDHAAIGEPVQLRCAATTISMACPPMCRCC
jgi:sulfite reductase (NADPH) flavoprotein alpha-component